MKVSFFVPEYVMPSQEEKERWLSGESLLIYPSGVISVVYNWIYQSWFFLQQAGVECELVTTIPREGILIANSDTLALNRRELEGATEDLFIVNALSDSVPFRFAQFYLSQNGAHARIMPRSLYMPHWPYPRLIPRNSARGDLFEKVAFIGNLENLDPFLLSREWQKRLYEELRLSFVAPDFGTWNDLSDVDLLIGIRSFSKARYLHKPSSKLYNAWQAGIPFIGGADASYRYDGHPGHDYLIATTRHQLFQILHLLKENVALRKSLVEHGKKSIERFSQEALTERWKCLVEEELPARAAEWLRFSYRRRKRFWREQQLTLKWDYLLRWPFYHPPKRKGIRDGAWSFFLEDYDKIPQLDREIEQAKEFAQQFREEGNQELSSRWLHVIKLLKQLLYLKNVHGKACEPPFVITPHSPVYLQEAEKLHHFYLAVAREAGLKGNAVKEKQLLRWAVAMQEVSGYYEKLVTILLEESRKPYRLPLQELPHLWQQLLQQQEEKKFTKVGCVIFYKKLLAQEIEGGNALLQKIKHQQKTVSPHEEYDQLLGIYWKHQAVCGAAACVEAINKGYGELLPFWKRFLRAAQGASSSRFQAIMVSQEGGRYHAGILRKIGYWEANRAQLIKLELDAFFNGQLSFALPKPLYHAAKSIERTLFLYRFVTLPLLAFASHFLGGIITNNWYTRCIYHLEKLPQKKLDSLFAILEKHAAGTTQVEGDLEKMKNSWKKHHE